MFSNLERLQPVSVVRKTIEDGRVVLNILDGSNYTRPLKAKYPDKKYTFHKNTYIQRIAEKNPSYVIKISPDYTFLPNFIEQPKKFEKEDLIRLLPYSVVNNYGNTIYLVDGCESYNLAQKVRSSYQLIMSKQSITNKLARNTEFFISDTYPLIEFENE
jgi:hypothetical protein